MGLASGRVALCSSYFHEFKSSLVWEFKLFLEFCWFGEFCKIHKVSKFCVPWSLLGVWL